jgi:hypothetical protein
MFCAPILILCRTEGVGSRLHVLRFRTVFRRYRERQIRFSFFFASERVFGGTEGVGSHFHVLRSQTWLGLYRGHRVPFSCFVLPDSLSTVPRARGPVFMFYALGIVWGRTKGGESRFKVLSSMSRFHILRS